MWFFRFKGSSGNVHWTRHGHMTGQVHLPGHIESTGDSGHTRDVQRAILN